MTFHQNYTSYMVKYCTMRHVTSMDYIMDKSTHMSGCFHLLCWPNEGNWTKAPCLPSFNLAYNSERWLLTGRISGPRFDLFCRKKTKTEVSKFLQETDLPATSQYFSSTQIHAVALVSHLVNLAHDLWNSGPKAWHSMDTWPDVFSRTFTLFAIERLRKVSFQICQPLFLFANIAQLHQTPWPWSPSFSSRNQTRVMNSWITNHQWLSSYSYRLSLTTLLFTKSTWSCCLHATILTISLKILTEGHPLNKHEQE